MREGYTQRNNDFLPWNHGVGRDVFPRVTLIRLKPIVRIHHLKASKVMEVSLMLSLPPLK